jgi:hypothetical protein
VSWGGLKIVFLPYGFLYSGNGRTFKGWIDAAPFSALQAFDGRHCMRSKIAARLNKFATSRAFASGVRQRLFRFERYGTAIAFPGALASLDKDAPEIWRSLAALAFSASAVCSLTVRSIGLFAQETTGKLYAQKVVFGFAFRIACAGERRLCPCAAD